MFLFPDRCSICDAEGRSPCAVCASRLIAPPVLDVPAELDSLTALFAYEAGGRRLITALKYRNRRGALSWMASELAAVVPVTELDCITWVPSSREGLDERGFDTGRLLARRLSRELRVPSVRLLTRLGKSRQTKSTYRERELGPQFGVTRHAFVVKSVLLVDDVCTTGASLTTAAIHLRNCGVDNIEAAVIARTPPRH